VPPRAKITKEMVIDAAFEVAREAGAENINARTVAKKLNCSTQPVMYHFATIYPVRKAAFVALCPSLYTTPHFAILPKF